MMPRLTPNSACLPLLLMLAASLVNYASAESWIPLTDEERLSTECPFDPNAGAEVLYKSILLDDEIPTDSFRSYYLRIKIYDEDEADAVGNFRMRYNSDSAKLGSHKARIIRVNGDIEMVEKSEFYELDLINDRDVSIKSKSFVFPELNPGDIVDIKYTISLDQYYFTPRLFVDFQEQWPVRRAAVKVRPARWVEGYGSVKWMTSKCDAQEMKQKNDGFFELDTGNFEALKDEPHSPPSKREVSWLLFYMSPDGRIGDRYWKRESQRMHKKIDSLTKPGKTITETLKTILDGLSNDDEKLRAIYRFCVTDLINAAHGRRSDIDRKQREKIDNEMTAEKILIQGFGSAVNINTVFCALARAAGFDARIAAVNDRTGYRFSKQLASVGTTMDRRCIAIQQDEQWNYFDPGGKYLAFGQLDWQEQGVPVLIADKKELIFDVIGFSSADDSSVKNDAKLILNEEGVLSGTVEIEFSGHDGVALKRKLDHRTPKAQREFVEKMIIQEWPGAAIEAVEVTNALDPIEPLKISFHLQSMPYADSAGDRLFIQMNVFKKSAEPEFPESERQSDLFFDFKSTEFDNVEIQWPDGYELEEASAPRPFEVANVFEYTPTLGIKKKSNTLVYSRTFKLGSPGFEAKHYKSIKKLFDELHRQDQHTIILKKTNTEAASL